MNKIAELADRAVLKISGEEAESFLQNLVTSDVTGLEVGDARYAALLTPQGKLLFDFFIIKMVDGYLIECALSQQSQLEKRLTMYKLRSNVAIETLDDARVFAAWGGPMPEASLVYADPRAAAMGWRVIGTLTANSDVSDYHAHRIKLGIADSDLDIGSGQLFPHEGNLDQLGGVSFTKGCFVGQEVVSRMEHRGTARTRFVIANAQVRIAPDTDVTAGTNKIGTVKSVAGEQGLALIRLDRAASALAEGIQITAGDIPIDITLPDWARFEIPKPTKGHG